MAALKWKKLAILAKPEATYGTDAEPTGMANYMMAIDAQYTPLEGGEVSRDLLLPYLGHQGVILTGLHSMLEFSIEVAGAGAAGTAPKYGPLLRACGMSEAIVAATSVVYAPVSDGEEAATIYFNRGGVRSVMVGCRGNVSLELTPQNIPRYRFRFLGLIGTFSDTALPAVNRSGFIDPVVVSKGNSSMTLHGHSCIMERLSMDLGNQIEPRMLVGYEGIELVDRKMTGSTVLQAVDLATKNWIDIAMKRTTGALGFSHGKTAGNIVEFDADRVQIGRVTEGQTQNITNNTLPLIMQPTNGNDEFSITVR